MIFIFYEVFGSKFLFDEVQLFLMGMIMEVSLIKAWQFQNLNIEDSRSLLFQAFFNVDLGRMVGEVFIPNL